MPAPQFPDARKTIGDRDAQKEASVVCNPSVDDVQGPIQQDGLEPSLRQPCLVSGNRKMQQEIGKTEHDRAGHHQHITLLYPANQLDLPYPMGNRSHTVPQIRPLKLRYIHSDRILL